MRIYEKIFNLQERSRWVTPIITLTKSRMSIIRFYNGDWMEKYIKNLNKISYYTQNGIKLEGMADKNNIPIDDCIYNHSLNDIHLELKSVDYMPN